MMPPTYTHEDAHIDHAPPPVQRIDDTRGTWGMMLFILTEAVLFVLMFFSYYYVEKGNLRWASHNPPTLYYSLPQLGVLILACLILRWGRGRALEDEMLKARLAVVAGIILGLGYIVLTYFDFASRWPHLTPQTDSYGSNFYSIITLHGAHLVLGILMLIWLLFLPKYEPMEKPPHRPYYNILIYWYFLAAMWLAVVAILYIGPNVYTAL